MAIKKITDFTELTGANVDQNVDVLAIVDVGADTTKKVTVGSLHSGSFSGSYVGDGSALTGVGGDAFPFTGDASITGSLTVSGSFNAFRLSTNDVILGEGAGNNTTVNANSNVMVGYQVGYTNTTGDHNVVLGNSAGYNMSTNATNENVIIGKEAGYGTATGGHVGSVLLGRRAGYTIKSGDYNIGVGYNSLFYNLIGHRNIAIGYQAGQDILKDDNIVIGYAAGQLLVSGSNIFMGSGSLGGPGIENHLRIGHADLITISASLATGDIIFPSTASADYFVGDGSKITNLPASSTFPFTGDAQITGSLTISGSFHSFTLDSDNIVLGAGAGTAMLAAASNNVILGTDAGAALTTGVQNVFIGDQAGNNGDTEIANILIGYKAGYNFGSGARSSYNICIGNSVASSGTGADGKYNIFMGYQSGNTLTSGDFNVGYGHQSLMGIIGGVNNTALGYLAGGSINSGDSNINIGYWAGKNQTTGDGNITMGSGSLGKAGESNQLRIGNGNSLTTISASLATGETIVRSQRPITTHTVDFTASMDYIGQYNRVSGDLTCSILPTATYAVATGAEFDFFQTSSAGYMLITGSGVTINSKNNNFNLAGQFSSATLKKVGSDEWDLIGDLT